MPRPINYLPGTVQAILDGKRPPYDVAYAFYWESAPEGHAYWTAVSDSDELSPEARAKLEAWQADAETNEERIQRRQEFDAAEFADDE